MRNGSGHGSATLRPTASGLDAGQGPRIGDDPGDRGRRGGQRRGQERPAALALAALEVAVARADGVLAGRAAGRRSSRCTSSSPTRATPRRPRGRSRARPSRFGLRASPASLPGATIRRTPSATWRSFSAAAASRRSLIRPLVHEPTKTTSTGWPMIGWPGLEVHVLERVLAAPGARPDRPRPPATGPAT